MADHELPPSMTIHELSESGAPAGQISAIQRWYESVKGGSSAMARAKLHAAAAGEGLRQGGESLLVGAMLGAMDTELKNGLDIKGKVPADAVVGVAGLLAGAAMAHTPYGVDLRNAGGAGLAIFGYRKTRQLLSEKKRQSGKKPGYEQTSDKLFEAAGEGMYNPGATQDIGAEDPIIAAARLL